MHHDINPGVFIGFGWAILWIAFGLTFFILNRRERMHLYDLADKAASEGRTLPPEIFARLRRRPFTCQRDIRTGLILLAIGIGLFVGGLINYYDFSRTHPSAEMFHGPFALFPIPVLLGIAFLIMGWLRRNEPPEEKIR